jgi:hypothetical protein
MGLIVEFTGGRRCTGCGGWIDPARMRIFAGAVICESCRNLRRRTSAASGAASGARRRAFHLVPPDEEDLAGVSGSFGEIPAE